MVLNQTTSREMPNRATEGIIQLLAGIDRAQKWQMASRSHAIKNRLTRGPALRAPTAAGRRTLPPAAMPMPPDCIDALASAGRHRADRLDDIPDRRRDLADHVQDRTNQNRTDEVNNRCPGGVESCFDGVPSITEKVDDRPAYRVDGRDHLLAYRDELVPEAEEFDGEKGDRSDD